MDKKKKRRAFCFFQRGKSKNNDRGLRDFSTERCWRWTGLVLMGLLCCGLAGLAFGQVALQSGLSERLSFGGNWYGKTYQIQTAAGEQDDLWGNVTLELVGFSALSRASVLINGKSVGNFTEQAVTVRVVRGDKLAVDTSAYALPVSIRIKSVSSIIDSSKLQELTTARQETVRLGIISFR